jgi:four helix bundle protein
MTMSDTVDNPEGESHEGPKFDLAERTAVFGEAIIRFAKRVPRNPITVPLIIQLVKAGTSIGANYGEADDAISKRDFRHRIGITKKESRESKFWLRMIVAAVSELKPDARVLWREANELYLIFSAIHRRTNPDED